MCDACGFRYTTACSFAGRPTPSQALNFWHAKHNDKRARLKAVVVESVNVDGKPRQKHVAFLGSIPV